tara:strand:- start:121 stop:600 length:480 start_codon:yes stop_codon:yes gene_type:complete
MESLFKKIGLGSLATGGGVLFIIYAILDTVIKALAVLLPLYLSIISFMEGSVIAGILYLIIGIPLSSFVANFFSPLIIILGFICTLYWLIGGVILGNDISIIGTFIAIWDFIFWKGLLSIIIIGVVVVVSVQFFGWLSERKETRQSKEVINTEYETLDD